MFTTTISLTDKNGLVEKLVENKNGLVEKLAENQIIIINAIKEDKSITISKLSAIVGISTTAIDKNLVKLKEAKIIERIGPDKGGYWKILIDL